MPSRAKAARFAALALTAAASLAVPAVAHSQLLEAKVVSLQAAKTMAVAAEAEAKKHGWSVAVAVVDVSGNLIVFDRMDDVQIGSVDVAIQKARTAARFRRPTKALADALATSGPEEDGRANRRKVREGIVVSDAMSATVVVAVVERVRHPKYGKTVQRTKKLYVHDADDSAKGGDRVRVQETRPLSKLKRWRLTEVLERAR